MALAIRNADVTETFDLGGQSASTLTALIQDAFTEPCTDSTVKRITLITGAGKLGRQKYDASAAKIVMHELQQAGYIEDRGASAIAACAGSYKSQHDTGKNLKTIVVFPKIIEQSVEGVTDGVNGLSVGGACMLSEDSPEYKLAVCPGATLERILAAKCPTWSQKKQALAVLDDLCKQVQALDQKLMTGTVLTEAEQDFYDTVSSATLETKCGKIKEWMHAQVDEGKLTAAERALLLQQVQDRMAIVNTDIAACGADSATKKQKLQSMHTKLHERQTKLSSLVPLPPPPLKHQPDIMALQKDMAPLADIQTKAAGRLLSVKESIAVGKLEELQQQVVELEDDSRGWWETDDAFEARVKASRQAVAAAGKQSKKKGKAAAAGAGGRAGNLPSSAKWVVPGASTARGKKPTAAKNKAPRGGGVFAAMMMDSDSD